jgi:hypothetical protein
VAKIVDVSDDRDHSFFKTDFISVSISLRIFLLLHFFFLSSFPSVCSCFLVFSLTVVSLCSFFSIFMSLSLPSLSVSLLILFFFLSLSSLFVNVYLTLRLYISFILSRYLLIFLSSSLIHLLFFPLCHSFPLPFLFEETA